MTATSTVTSFHALRQQLNAAFPERRDVVDGSLAAVLANEHVFLLGPPGTAKSAFARSLSTAFAVPYFERLLTKFSTPEELFGPLSLKALEQDRYARLVDGYLPTAAIAFLDEFFKANSAILNALLSLMNERVFHNDAAAVPTPLISLFGASNELPEGKELEATFDRFLVRYELAYLRRDTHLRAVLASPDPAVSTRIPVDTLRAAQAEVAAVAVSDATYDALLAIRQSCKAEGVIASDRRWKKLVRLTQAAAWLTNATTTTPEDLLILTDSLWREPKERSKIARLVGEKADPVSAKAAEILDAAHDTAARVAALSGDRRAYIAKGAEALEDFRQQQQRLDDLKNGAGPRAATTITDAVQQIQQLHAEIARALSSGLGIGGAR